MPPDKTLRLINISRFDPRKGHIELLYALKLLKDRNVNIHATLVGPFQGSNVHTLFDLYEELKLKESLCFIHGVNTEEKYQLLYKADVFVMPSQNLETFGMTMLEAMSVGVPVLGTDQGAIRELLEKVDRRLIISGNNSQAIAEKIEWFYQTSIKEKKLLSKKSRAFIKRTYSYEKISPLFQSIINNITA